MKHLKFVRSEGNNRKYDAQVSAKSPAERCAPKFSHFSFEAVHGPVLHAPLHNSSSIKPPKKEATHNTPLRLCTDFYLKQFRLSKPIVPSLKKLQNYFHISLRTRVFICRKRLKRFRARLAFSQCVSDSKSNPIHRVGTKFHIAVLAG